MENKVLVIYDERYVVSAIGAIFALLYYKGRAEVRKASQVDFSKDLKNHSVISIGVNEQEHNLFKDTPVENGYTKKLFGARTYLRISNEKANKDSGFKWEESDEVQESYHTDNYSEIIDETKSVAGIAYDYFYTSKYSLEPVTPNLIYEAYDSYISAFYSEFCPSDVANNFMRNLVDSIKPGIMSYSYWDAIFNNHEALTDKKIAD